MSETTTKPEGSQGPRTEWDIGEAMGSLLSGPAEEAQPEGEPEAGPDGENLEAAEELDGEHAEADEAEGEDMSEDEDAEPEDEDTSDEPFLRLTVDGEQVDVKDEEEARNLAQKGMHYTKEMQALREEQRKWEGEREQMTAGLKQQEEQYVQALGQLQSTFGAVLGEEPDWSALYSQNPEEYARQRAQWDQLAAIRTEQERIARERQGEQMKEFQSWVSEQKDKLMDLRPEWSDSQALQRDREMIADYARAQGVSDQELSGVYDARFIAILHDAARYRQAQATGKSKAKQAKTKTAAPGTGDKVSSSGRRIRQQRERLRETGDESAAADIFQQLLTKR